MDWITEELASLSLGDKRLDNRAHFMPICLSQGYNMFKLRSRNFSFSILLFIFLLFTTTNNALGYEVFLAENKGLPEVIMYKLEKENKTPRQVMQELIQGNYLILVDTQLAKEKLDMDWMDSDPRKIMTPPLGRTFTDILIIYRMETGGYGLLAGPRGIKKDEYVTVLTGAKKKIAEGFEKRRFFINRPSLISGFKVGHYIDSSTKGGPGKFITYASSKRPKDCFPRWTFSSPVNQDKIAYSNTIFTKNQQTKYPLVVAVDNVKPFGVVTLNTESCNSYYDYCCPYLTPRNEAPALYTTGQVIPGNLYQKHKVVFLDIGCGYTLMYRASQLLDLLFYEIGYITSVTNHEKTFLFLNNDQTLNNEGGWYTMDFQFLKDLISQLVSGNTKDYVIPLTKVTNPNCGNTNLVPLKEIMDILSNLDLDVIKKGENVDATSSTFSSIISTPSSTASADSKLDEKQIGEEWYDDYMINEILGLCFDGIPRLQRMTAINAEAENGEIFLNNLIARETNIRESELTPGELIHQLIVPINLGEYNPHMGTAGSHWVGLYILRHPDNGGPIQIWYFDPFGEDMPAHLEVGLYVIYPSAQLTVIPIRFQNDWHNCGTWIIEIFKYLVASGKVPPEDFDIREARLEHTRQLRQAGRLMPDTAATQNFTQFDSEGVFIHNLRRLMPIMSLMSSSHSDSQT